MRDVLPGRLWIGHAGDARSVREVVDLGIRAVVHVALEEAPVTFPREMACCRIPWVDGSGNPPALLRLGIGTVVELVESGLPTLVTCGGGMSRSPALAAAAIALVEGISPNEALVAVAAAGPHDVAPALWEDLQRIVGERARSRPGASAASTDFLAAAIDAFESHKRIADKAIAQVSDDGLRVNLHAETNSIAVIMKHVAGNLLSRWTDFLSTDGEKPWRNRDDEFVDSFRSRRELLDYWEQGWRQVMFALRNLSAADLLRTVAIRGEPHTVPLAVERSLAHTAYHVGQIVQVARIQAGDRWQTLSIPRGGSEQFNREHWGPLRPSP